MLGCSVSYLESLPYDEIEGWFAYFERRPYGWREDNRAAITTMAMAGSKVKPEDLFESLRTIKEESSKAYAKKNPPENFAQKFLNKFSTKATNAEGLKALNGEDKNNN